MQNREIAKSAKESSKDNENGMDEIPLSDSPPLPVRRTLREKLTIWWNRKTLRPDQGPGSSDGLLNKSQKTYCGSK